MSKNGYKHGAGDWGESDLSLPAANEFDREIDAALSRYAVVEPRAGLEERVLANLDAQRRRSQFRVSRWWLVAGVAVAAVVIAIVVSLSTRAQKLAPVAFNPSAGTQNAHKSETPIATSPANSADRTDHAVRVKKFPTRGLSARTAGSGGTRMQQFPSPLPLSEQEKLLASYVRQFRDQAVLVARARTEELRRDLAEELSNSTEDSERDNSNKPD
jgi:hypothetical protein